MEFRKAIKLLEKYDVVLAIGDESFYRDQVTNKMASIHNELDLLILDAKEYSESEVISQVRSKDLFNSKKIFCIKNFTKIKNLNLIVDKNNTNIIILDSEIKGKSSTYNELEKNCLYIECDKPKKWEQENDGINKIVSYTTNAGFIISNENAQEIYTRIGYNLHKIMKELQKLLMYKEYSESKEIKIEDINSICIPSGDIDTFSIIDRVIDGDKQKAIELLDRLLIHKRSSTNTLPILWHNHLENILYVKTNKNNLYSSIKLPSSVIDKKIKPQSKKIKLDKILSSLKYLSDVDLKLRKGSLDISLYLYKFILDF